MAKSLTRNPRLVMAKGSPSCRTETTFAHAKLSSVTWPGFGSRWRYRTVPGWKTPGVGPRWRQDRGQTTMSREEATGEAAPWRPATQAAMRGDMFPSEPSAECHGVNSMAFSVQPFLGNNQCTSSELATRNLTTIPNSYQILPKIIVLLTQTCPKSNAFFGCVSQSQSWYSPITHSFSLLPSRPATLFPAANPPPRRPRHARHWRVLLIWGISPPVPVPVPA